MIHYIQQHQQDAILYRKVYHHSNVSIASDNLNDNTSTST